MTLAEPDECEVRVIRSGPKYYHVVIEDPQREFTCILYHVHFETIGRAMKAKRTFQKQLLNGNRPSEDYWYEQAWRWFLK